MKQEKPELFYLKPLEQVPGHKLLLNRQQLTLFALVPGRRLNLQLGFNRLPVEIAEQDDDSALTTLYLSGAAFAKLDHYHGEPLWLAFLSDNKMVLGPTVGITVSAGSWEKIDKIYALEKRALLALEKGILFYCFQLSKVDLEKRLVEAYYYHPREHSWRRKFLPFPQVLYHRSVFPCLLPAKQADKLNVYEQIWANPEIQKINNACRFDKWSVYQTLSRSEETEKFQPETVLLSPLSLKEFLSKYKFCYVKTAMAGAAGRFFGCKRREPAIFAKPEEAKSACGNLGV
jgi:hypothetical protein